VSVVRAIWKATLTKSAAPAWPCPRCGVGRLLIQKDSVHVVDTKDSKLANLRDGYHPGNVEGRFVALLRCSERSCQEPVVVSGTSGYEQEYEPEGREEWSLYLQPVSVHPSPDIFVIPEAAKWPDPVVKEIRRAFSLYWGDREAAANAIRSAVEVLLTHLKVRRFALNKNGRRYRLSLDARLKLLEPTNPALARGLMAVKWIGNAGSHPEELSKDDVLDGFEILDHVMTDAFSRHEKARIAKLAREITRRKGPRSRRRKT